MENGDLEKQPKPHDTVMISADTGLATADPPATESTATDLAEPAATERCLISLEPVAKESLWQRLRNQPREAAAIVVLVVTAIIWLDSGDSNSPKGQTSKSLDPMDGFESYLSDFDTEESSMPLKESADPADTQSPALNEGDLKIPQTQQSEFASTVAANYADSVFEPSNASAKNRDSAATQHPADADAYGSPTARANTGSTGFDTNNSGSQQNRRVRFAGRIKLAN